MSSNSKSRSVPILNPLDGGNRYTSRRRADDFVRRGVAELTPTGLRFLDDVQSLRVAQREQRESGDVSILQDRGGVVWWNGCDSRPFARHEPGKTPFFPKPRRPILPSLLDRGEHAEKRCPIRPDARERSCASWAGVLELLR